MEMAAKSSDWRPGPTVCRCCLAEGCYKDISTEYFWMGKREVYAEMLSETLNLSIAYAQSGPNSNSRLICEPCISRLRDAAEFKRQVIECEKTFMNYLDPGSTSVQKEVLMQIDSLEEVKIERVKQEKVQSDDDDFDDTRVDFVIENDDDDDDLDNEPLMKLASKVPKKEIDLQDLLDNTELTIKRKTTGKSKEPPAKKKKIVIKPSASKPTASVSKEEKKKKGSIQIKWQKSNRFGDSRDNAAIVLECSNACLFKFYTNVFSCAYCSFSSPEFKPIRIHTDKVHTERVQVLKNYKPSKILKADITNLECKLCNKTMTNFTMLYDHLLNIHEKPLAKKYDAGIIPYLICDGFTCVECGLTFDRFINLSRHLNEHNPGYVCSKCGQGYCTAARLGRHMAIAHREKRTKFKCTQCDKVFPTQYKKKKHMMDVHKIFIHKCPYCDKKFENYRRRAAHLDQFHGAAAKYPCSMCPAVYKSAAAKLDHVRRIHTGEKNHICPVCSSAFFTSGEMKNHMIKHDGERKFQCTVCEKAYARKKTLKEHMRIHNNDRRFACEYCDRAFVQKCSLKGHIKTHHPKA